MLHRGAVVLAVCRHVLGLKADASIGKAEKHTAAKGVAMLVEHLVLVNDVSASITDAALGWAGPAPTPSPSPVPGPAINTDGIIDFIITKIVPILLAAIGVVFISRAGKGEISRVLTSTSIVIIGLVFIAGGLAMFAFSRALVNLILGPTPEP